MNKIEAQQLITKYNLNLIGNVFAPPKKGLLSTRPAVPPKHNLVLSNLSNLKLNLFMPKDPHAVKAMTALGTCYPSDIIQGSTLRYDGIPVIWGNDFELINWCWAENIDFLHLDLPYVDDWEALKYHDNLDRFRLSINNTQKFHTAPRDGERLHELQHITRNHFKPWKNNTKGPVLVCPPSLATCKLYQVDIDEWLDNTISEIKQAGMPFKVRFKPPAGEGLLEDLSTTSMVATYNSMVAVDALFHGVPVCVGPLSVAVGLSKGFPNAKRIQIVDRSEWAQHVAWSQWRTQELATGVALHATLEEYPLYSGFRVTPR